jgi:hypothetical protein
MPGELDRIAKGTVRTHTVAPSVGKECGKPRVKLGGCDLNQALPQILAHTTLHHTRWQYENSDEVWTRAAAFSASSVPRSADTSQGCLPKRNVHHPVSVHWWFMAATYSFCLFVLTPSLGAEDDTYFASASPGISHWLQAKPSCSRRLPSYEMWRVALVRIDVSEENITSIIMVTRIGELGKNVSSN